MWYIKYFWIKVNIMILTPLVWIENKYNEYKEWRLKTYIKYICSLDNYEFYKSK